MIAFYKHHLQYLTESAVNPDRRRYIVPEEGARHYIDLDRYEGLVLPEQWHEAVAQMGEDSLQRHGILPWHLAIMVRRLENAFASRSTDQILRLSAELGHYVGDAHVPLHTTSNYDGQFTDQKGIHALWESRLPELFFEEYDFFVGKAEYIENIQRTAWEIIRDSHRLVDSVLTLERNLSGGGEARFNYETKGKNTVRVFAYPFSRKYHQLLQGMVERKWRKSIHLTASFWYTAWVNAGQPDLSRWMNDPPDAGEQKRIIEEIKALKKQMFEVRPHETDSVSPVKE